jgi:hypothetical protein
MRRCLPALLITVIGLHAQGPPAVGECLEALARAAATFAITAPGLRAAETLDQRGRRGFVEMLRGQRGKKDTIRFLDVKLPPDFRVHQVVSKYSLVELGEARALHETRSIVTFDGQAQNPPSPSDARHTLTIGLPSADDQTIHTLLEDLARNQLEGAVTDFGQLMLLFAAHLQKNYVFTRSADQRLDEEAMIVIAYRQTSGSQGLAFFQDRTGARQLAAGEIWFRSRDLLPIRITIKTHELLSTKFTIRTEAIVDYMPSPFGLVPRSVAHKQFLNSDLMVENDLHYADFSRDNAMIP